MTTNLPPIARVGQLLPSRTRQICPIVVGLLTLGACATEPDTTDPVTCAEPRLSRITSVVLPLNNAQARATAFDLDGDNRPDNQLGMVAGTLETQIGDLGLADAATARLGDDVVWYLAVRACSDDTVTIDLGNDGAAEAHLAGHVDGDGWIYATGAGGALPMSTLFDPTATFADAGWLDSARSAIALRPLGDGWDGRIGMVLDHAAMTAAVVPPMTAYFNSSHSQDFLDLFDTPPRDGVITVAEVTHNMLTTSLLWPDIEDRGRSLGISIGVGITARDVD